MANDNRWVTFVAKLNRMTQEGSLQWEMYNPPTDLVSGTDSKIPMFFGTELKDRKIAIYLERYRDYNPDRDQLYWSSRVVLAFCASDWSPIWEFPKIAGIYELFDSVQRHVADIDSFIDNVLAEDKEGKQ
jgi:hypothetical protein